MSSILPADRRAFLHDTFGRVINGEELSPQTYMDGYVLIFELTGRDELSDFCPGIVGRNLKPAWSDWSLARAEVYNFIRDSLSQHIHAKVFEAKAVHELADIGPNQRAHQLIAGLCAYLRHYIAQENMKDITLIRNTYLEVKCERVLATPVWLDEWLENAISCVENGADIADDTKKVGQLFLEAYSQRPDYYDTHFAAPFIRAAVAHYHEEGKKLVAEENPVAYHEKKHEIMRLESARGEVYLYHTQRRDYLETLGELFDLGDEKFQWH